jgi:hypothetical protein
MKNKSITIVLFILEILIIISYASAFVPFIYILLLFGTIPLTLANMVISLVYKSETSSFAIANFIISIVGIMPFIGYPLRIVGFFLALLSAIRLGDKLK